MRRLPACVALAFALVTAPCATAQAQRDGISIDPNGPTAREYEIPLEAERRRGDAAVRGGAEVRRSDPVPGDAAAPAAPLFGRGVTPQAARSQRARVREGLRPGCDRRRGRARVGRRPAVRRAARAPGVVAGPVDADGGRRDPRSGARRRRSQAASEPQDVTSGQPIRPAGPPSTRPGASPVPRPAPRGTRIDRSSRRPCGYSFSPAAIPPPRPRAISCARSPGSASWRSDTRCASSPPAAHRPGSVACRRRCRSSGLRSARSGAPARRWRPARAGHRFRSGG